ncbi:VOC family protein [Aureimonas sp. Leaf324]|jgi:catechol 2,3-dioxygenase-like lactoylglutathione lyase family enzyme|uniref:VOC family protein n=1 Tax=Aureimonas sp. Leaf324 TaxID=1736336 RepID=UPI0006FF178D|nr:VOC family protein [Aureimonas sp. Leaf324]KQQ90292.1 glyoxalase [Aureimonas sp. Leaf324]
MARRIDHLVVGVRDLDAAAAFYARLGFHVGARNRHPWGTQNRLIQFGTSFLELITVGDDPAAIPAHAPRRFSFGAFVRDALERRDGISMLVLDSPDAAADAERFRAAGIGDFEPFFFRRHGRRPDGEAIEVAFTLAFAADAAAPEAGFFVCQQHRPENFWNAAFQRHPNGARDIAAVTLEAPDPTAHLGFLQAFAGVSEILDNGSGVPLNGSRIELVTGPAPARFTGFAVRVPDLAPVAARLRSEGIAFDMEGSQLLVAAAAAFGTAIRFETA